MVVATVTVVGTVIVHTAEEGEVEAGAAITEAAAATGINHIEGVEEVVKEVMGAAEAIALHLSNKQILKQHSSVRLPPLSAEWENSKNFNKPRRIMMGLCRH